MKIPLLIHHDSLEISEYHRKALKQAVNDSGAPLRAEITILTPESRNMRKFLMGGLIPLWIYLDGNDHRDSKLHDYYFDHAKKELTPEIAIKIGGKIQVFGKSSKGSKALRTLTEKLIDFLCEQYGLSHGDEVFNTDNYKKWRDVLLGEGDDYISYAERMGWIKRYK